MRATVKTTNNAQAVRKAAYAGVRKSIFAGAGLVRKIARNSIRRSDKASPPGKPPRTRRGAMKNAIAFAVETAEGEPAQRAIIGPAAMFVGPSGRAHEDGGEFRGETYPDRPFMRPALEAALPRLPESLRRLFG